MLSVMGQEVATQVDVSTDYRLVVDPLDDDLAAAKACEAAVFLDAYGNSSDQWVQEYGPYESESLFIAVYDRGGDAVGAIRMIMPGETSVKSLADVARPPWRVDGRRSALAAGLDLARTWDVATLAVRRKHSRGGLITAAMYHGMLQTLRANRAGWLVMIMDERARRLLDMVGLRTNVLPGTAPGPYLGSPNSVPLWSHVASMVDGQRRLNPEAHRLIVTGIGLDSIAVPVDFTVERSTEHAEQRSNSFLPLRPAAGH